MAAANTLTDVELVLVVGTTQPIEIELVRSDGSKEDLADVDKATFQIRKSAKGAIIYDRSLSAGNIAVDVENSLLVCTHTSAEADSWRSGIFIAQAAVRYGAESRWVRTDPFTCRIKPGFAPKA